MSTILSDQLKQILEIAKKSFKTSQRIEEVQDHDREDFSNLVNRVGHMEVELKSLRDTVNKIPGLTQEKVAEAVAPVINEAQALGKTIEEKKAIPVIQPNKKSWRDRLLRK